jgi:drug/metabolite transporter (DMT)-like permease
VVGAALPVIAGLILEGLPGGLQLAGMFIGLGGIWIVSRPAGGESELTRTDILHGTLAGIGFGGFFILIAQVEGDSLFLPLVIVKVTALVFSIIILAIQGQRLPRLSGNPPALLAGVLDSGGNLFYLLATGYTTLSIAAVLSSMYPVATIILAVTILRQRIARLQSVGILLCILAVALISA